MGFFEGETPEKESSFLMAIKEKAHSGGDPLAHEFGVCFLDACIGTFHVRCLSFLAVRLLSIGVYSSET